MANPSTVKVQIQNTLPELSRVVDQMQALFKQIPLDKKQQNDIFLIIDEVLTNIINYAYEDDLSHFIDVHINLSEQNFTMIVTDDGKYFDMTVETAIDTSGDIESRELGGLGIFFVQKLTDKLSYSRRDDKNVLKLVKNFSPSSLNN